MTVQKLVVAIIFASTGRASAPPRACDMDALTGRSPRGTGTSPPLLRIVSTASGTIAAVDASTRRERDDLFFEVIDDALNSLPANLRAAISNVEIVVEDEPADGQPLLGLYQGVPLPAKDQHVQRSAPRQDQHLRWPDNATRCR